MAQALQTSGLANVVNALLAFATAPKYIQWGTGTAAAQTANAVTAGATTEARAVGTLSAVTTTVTGDTLQVVGTLTAAETLSITEVGVFDAAGTGSPPVGGNMDIYGSFASIGLSAADSITFTIKVQFS